jgi:PREDICTED: similar to predicted protein
MVVLVTSQSIVFFDPTLEPFFRSNNWDTNKVALAFFIMSGSIALFLPFFSLIAQKVKNSYILMFTGLIVTASGLLFVAPSHLITSIKSSLPLSIGSLIVIGIGYGLAFLPTFENLFVTALNHGLKDDLSTYSTVSGLWSTTFALGYVDFHLIIISCSQS